MKKFSLFTGSIISGLSVAIGAFGAHAWKDYLRTINRLDTFETAAQYQMYGGLTLLLLGIWQIQASNRLLKSAGYLIFSGSLIFPGSLYLICLTQNTFWGMIAPIGGLAYITGFAFMAYGTQKH
ncbi:DUF423 domain-containing protein [Aquirufa sp.]|jgi:uncharacterized membrane protein YgdD (TMEM256/DUF423 family)|uniref:DUF423 domain-containing protein n=1 Tax=Aquirufa sp. TaxID=2676249 RepID=UPI0037C14C9B